MRQPSLDYDAANKAAASILIRKVAQKILPIFRIVKTPVTSAYAIMLNLLLLRCIAAYRAAVCSQGPCGAKIAVDVIPIIIANFDFHDEWIIE